MALMQARSSCPPENELLLLGTGESGPAETTLKAHLIGCPRCRALVETYRQLGQGLKEAFRPEKQLPPNPPGAVDRIFAQVAAAPIPGPVPAVHQALPLLLSGLLVIVVTAGILGRFSPSPSGPSTAQTQGPGPAESLPEGSLAVEFSGGSPREALLQGTPREVGGHWFLAPGEVYHFSRAGTTILSVAPGCTLTVTSGGSLQPEAGRLLLREGKFQLSGPFGPFAGIPRLTTPHLTVLEASGTLTLEISPRGTRIDGQNGWARVIQAGITYEIRHGESPFFNGKDDPYGKPVPISGQAKPPAGGPPGPTETRLNGHDSGESATTVTDR